MAEPLLHARYSGGAAPDSHRLPYIPVRVLEISLGSGETARKCVVRGTWCVVPRTTHNALRTGFLFSAHTSAPAIAAATIAMT